MSPVLNKKPFPISRYLLPFQGSIIPKSFSKSFNVGECREGDEGNIALSCLRNQKLFPLSHSSYERKNMELVSKIVDAATRALNNNTVINVCLVASFATLGIRSLNQQKLIEALEAEKEKLVKSNKAMRNTMWDWKQQLFAEASSDSALVPLARLQAIYGEAPLPEHATPEFLGNTVEQDGSSSGAVRFIV